MQRLILLVLAIVLFPSLALARSWTNRQGKEIIADFVDATAETVTLKKSDGKVVTFKLELLSDEDQHFIRGILARRVGKTAAPSEAPGSPFEAVPSSTKPATDLRSAVESKGSDEKVEGLGTMRDVNESKKKMKIENREWTDAFGNKSAGKFIRFQGNNVLVLRSGRQMTLDYWQLSDADHEYLRELCEAYGQSHLIPKVNPAEQRNNGPGANVAGNPAGSSAVPGVSNPPPGAFAAGPSGASSSPPPSSVPSSPRIGNPEDLARRLRELEENAKAAATYAPPPSPAIAGSSTFPSSGGASYDTPPSASASYSPPPGASPSTPPSASAGYSSPPGASYSPPPGASYTPPPGPSFTSPSMGSSMPSSAMPGSSMPSIPSPSFNVPSVTFEKQCENCGKVLPASFTAGHTCPGCGVYFSHDDTNGKTASTWGSGGGGGMSRGAFRGIALLVVVAIKAVAFIAWRSQQS